MTASNFDTQFLPQREALNLCRCEICASEFNFAESIKAKRTLKGSFSCRIIIRRCLCRFSTTGKSTGGRGRTRNLGTATAGSDVVQSGRPIFDDFFQHLWPYIGNNTANVVFQMVKRLWLIRIDQ
ncbi:hypothetical protein TNCV_4810691 [Trichonephila clavipes]|nr:hypothetical protein TNCV_4810691 [Trichonephila clavipes]